WRDFVVMPLWPSRSACCTYRFEKARGRFRSSRARVTLLCEVEISAPAAMRAIAAPATQGRIFRAESCLIRFTSALDHVASTERDPSPPEGDGAPDCRAQETRHEWAVEPRLGEQAVPGFERRGQEERPQCLHAAERSSELHHQADDHRSSD